MDENRKAELRKFFSVSAAIFLVVYLIFLVLSLFSLSFSIPLFAGLMFVEFFLLMLKGMLDEKTEELGNLRWIRFVSLFSFTVLLTLCCIVMIYVLKIKKEQDMLLLVIALYNSSFFDKSICALRRLKQL